METTSGIAGERVEENKGEKKRKNVEASVRN